MYEETHALFIRFLVSLGGDRFPRGKDIHHRQRRSAKSPLIEGITMRGAGQLQQFVIAGHHTNGGHLPPDPAREVSHRQYGDRGTGWLSKLRWQWRQRCVLPDSAF
jgi:hypothetical protein